MKHHTAAEYGVTAQGLKGDNQMKYYPTDYKNIERNFKMWKMEQMIRAYRVKTMVHTYTTDQLLKDLAEIELNDPEYIVAVMDELCERGGLDKADYKDFDDCYYAILHEFDVRNEEEK